MARLETTYVSLPATERGRRVLISGDPKSSSIAYCNGRAVILRSLDDPLQVDVYTEHVHNTTVARFSPNGEWVASGDVTGNVRVWARRAEHNHILKFEIRALSGSIEDLQWSADGERIAVAGDGKGSQFVRCFMWDSGNNVGEFDGHSKRVLSCSLRPVRPFRMVTCGEDNLVNFYQGPPFRFSHSNREHSNYVHCIRYSPDGSKFISVSSDKKCVLYEGKSGSKMGELSSEDGHSGSVYAVCWSPDGKQLITVSADKTAKIWDISEEGTGTVNTTFTFAEQPGVEHMQVGCLWLPKHIVTISLSGDINYLSLSDPRLPSRILHGHNKFINAMQVFHGPEGEVELYTSSYDGALVRWRVGQGSLGRLQGTGQGNSIRKMALGDDHLITCSFDDTVRKMQLPAEQYSSDGMTDVGSQPKDISVATNNPKVVICITEKGLALLEGNTLLSTTPLGFQATAVGISPDGKEAIVGSSNGKLHVYAVRGDTISKEVELERHRAAITTLAYSPDGSMVASGDEKPEVVIWDSISREAKVKNMLYHTARVSCLAWSPDSTRVATGSLDTSVIVWDVSKPPSARLTIKRAHPGGVTCVAFKDKEALLSVGDDVCIRQWALP